MHVCSYDHGSCVELDDGAFLLTINGTQSSFTQQVRFCPWCGAGAGGQTIMVNPRHDVLPWEHTNDW